MSRVRASPTWCH